MKRRVFLKDAATVAIGAAIADSGVARAATVRRAVAGPDRSAPADASPRRRVSLDEGWRFHLGDIEVPGPRVNNETYDYTKAGNAAGAAGLVYDDAGWPLIDVPHDFVVEQPYVKEENNAQGYRPKDVGWYRKTLTLDPADRGKHIELQLDGLATTATVYFNGNVVAHILSGYSSSYIDVTPFARFGDAPNVIAVRVDSRPLQGWWYEGGGIYRHVWLVTRAPVHIVTDGIYAHPRKNQGDGWNIPIEVTLANSGEQPADVQIDAVLFDAGDVPLAKARAAVGVAPLAQSPARLSIDVASPRLWSIEQPTLYRAEVTVTRGGAIVDRTSVMIGFRTQHFDADKGFFLNGQPVKLKGTCNHQDHAGLGVALPDSIIEFRMRRLKELGCNAIRASHNAQTRELLDAADRLGFLVMNENRLFDPSPQYLELLEWLVRRDRNHPSVILWSVFNEEPLQGSPEGYEMVRRLAAAVRRLDDSRPVTAAMNGGLFEPVNVSQAVDVVGFNYQHLQYDAFHAANPTKPMFSSEDVSANMTRGEYVTDLKDRHTFSSYDEVAQPHGLIHRHAWKEIATRPYLAGGFAWTGFDYRGEPQPMPWPTPHGALGIMDLCGFPKSAFYIHQAMWITDRPILALIPHWNWPGREGQPIRVMAISNVESVALMLNGTLISEQRADPFEMNEWQVPYRPGRLEVVGRRGGRIVAHAFVETTGKPAALRLTPDRSDIAGDGRDAIPVTVEAVDDKGRPVPTANLPVTFQIDGGNIIGLGNGDPNSHERDKGDRRSLYNGLAQAIVQSRARGGGALVLTASAPGLKSATTRIVVGPARGAGAIA